MNGLSPRSRSPLAQDRGFLGIFAVLACLLALATDVARACPFCTDLGPTLSQQRESAAVAILAELSKTGADGQTFRIHRSLAGRKLLNDQKSITLALDEPLKPTSLVVLFGDSSVDDRLENFRWTVIHVNEASYAYLAQAPTLRIASAERLRYFARYLEHPDPLIARDAYLEFAHAPFDDVAAVADSLPLKRMRRWLVDAHVPPERIGFYGVALGLADDPADRLANVAVLERLIQTDEDDMRAGFDGMLGGYLRLKGSEGLNVIERRYLADPDSADGDVRHALKAIEFYYEYGRAIPREELQAAVRHLLTRPEFAARAITTLARWQDWTSAGDIAALYRRREFSAKSIRAAIVGYLLVCPLSTAGTDLAKLREFDAQGVADAEQVFSTLGTVRQ